MTTRANKTARRRKTRRQYGGETNPIDLLMNAIEKNELNKVNELLEQVDVNAEDEYERIPIVMASMGGNLDIVNALLEKRADVNKAQGLFKLTALIVASIRGHKDVVRRLIEKGVNVNAKDHNGVSALMVASQGGHLDVVNMLIAAGADVNDTDVNKKTALMFATQEGHRAVVRSLLQHMNPGAKNSTGKTAYKIAKQWGHPAVASILESVMPSRPRGSRRNRHPRTP